VTVVKLAEKMFRSYCLLAVVGSRKENRTNENPEEFKSRMCRASRRPWTPQKGNREGNSDSDFRAPFKNSAPAFSHLRAIAMDRPTPSPDDTEDLILSCRYGDLDDVKSFIDRFGTIPVGDARDDNGNNVLHLASANGHIGTSN